MKFANYMSFAEDLKCCGLEFAAERSARLGFDAVEFLIESPSDTPFSDLAGAKATKDVLDRFGLSVACYSIAANLTQDISDLFDHIELAAAVGSPFVHHTLLPVLSLSANSPKYEDVFDTVLENAVRAARHAEQHGIVCLYEPQGMYFNGTDGLARFFDAISQQCTNIGICGDTATSLFVDVDPTEIYTRFCKNIKHIHVHNYAVSEEASDLTGYHSRSGKGLSDVPLNQGVVDWKACFAKLDGFDGIVSLEMVADDAELKDTLCVLKSYFDSILEG